MKVMSICVFCKQKTAYEMRISDGSSDVCSSDLLGQLRAQRRRVETSNRQGRERRDAVLHVAEGRNEGGFLLDIRPIDGGRVFDAPMSCHRLARPDRAGFAGGVEIGRAHV